MNNSNNIKNVEVSEWTVVHPAESATPFHDDMQLGVEWISERAQKVLAKMATASLESLIGKLTKEELAIGTGLFIIISS